MKTKSKHAHCQLDFSPNAALLGPVRRFVGDFYSRILEDEDATSRIAVATHELLENAVKFSVEESTHVLIHVEPEDGEYNVTIETHNRTDKRHLGKLRGLFDKLEAAGDPYKFYEELIRESLDNDSEGSGLGLGRIYAEAEMTLQLDIRDSDQVCITAKARLAAPQT